MSSRLLSLAFICAAACGPETRDGDDDPSDACKPGAETVCYTGQLGTNGVGPCREGKSTCDANGVWGPCAGEVVPAGETCKDGVDNNCNGAVDEDEDKDGDGITTCAGDCCDSTECSAPALVNEGAFDAPGNMLDDDCDGLVDNTQLLCDQGLASNSAMGMDYAKAMELCQQTTMTEKRWGVIDAQLTLADGNGKPHARSHSIRPKFGTTVMPKGGVSMALLSTGAAAARNDMNPNYVPFQNLGNTTGNGTESAFPSDFVAKNGGKLPNAPNCPAPEGNNALDPVMLTLTIRVPTNARSFKLDTNFFSSEFPEYTCSPFNDFFVVLLSSNYAGTPANPDDRNLAFYSPVGSQLKYPVGVNLASGDTGLFTQCMNGAIGCEREARDGMISTCTSATELGGTGFDIADSGNCNQNSLQGGGTGWLRTSGNVLPGEVIKLRIAIWDTSDHRLDSLAIVDAFEWSVEVSQPGTVIF